MATLQRLEVPPEQGGAMLAGAVTSWWVATLEAFVRTVGAEKSAEVLGPVMGQLFHEDAKQVRENLHIEGDDALALASYINFWEQLMGIEGTFREEEPEKVVKVITKCPLSHASPEVCATIERALQGSAEELSPGYEFTQEHAMTRGDPNCCWKVHRK